MTRYVAFIELKSESGNVRQRKHRMTRHRDDQRLQREYLGPMLNVTMDRRAFVQGPHPQRRLTLTVFRKHSLDRDNLWSGLKPFIDVLRCRTKSFGKGKLKQTVLVWEGVIWDDSEKYVDLVIRQVNGEDIPQGQVEGVLIAVELIAPPVAGVANLGPAEFVDPDRIAESATGKETGETTRGGS